MLIELRRRCSLWWKGHVFFTDAEGLLHCESGPAVEYDDGSKTWYVHGKIHREDGPAVINRSGKYWHINGLQHREDGPAVKYWNGQQEWWYRGRPVRSMADMAYVAEQFRREEHASRFL